jgi:hypothetical protein
MNAILEHPFAEIPVAAPIIPYLTPALLISDGEALLGQIATAFPQTAPEVEIALAVVNIIDSIPSAEGIENRVLSAVCNRINALTGAVPPT